jgi:hypothetical protein
MRRKLKPRPKPPVGDVRDPDSLYHHMLRYLTHLAEKNGSTQITVGHFGPASAV